MAQTAVVYRDGKVIRTTVLSAAQVEPFVILAEGVRLAQTVLKLRQTNGSTSKASVDLSERHEADIYNALPRIAELVGNKDPRVVYQHLNENINGDVMRNTDGTPKHGLMLAQKHNPIVPTWHPAAALSSQASALGMIPLDGLAFDRTELLVDGAPPVQTGTEKRLDGLTYPTQAGGSAPTVRAFVRFHG